MPLDVASTDRSTAGGSSFEPVRGGDPSNAGGAFGRITPQYECGDGGAVVASILAIWQFTGTDALWRTVATCAVIGAATLAFSFVNGLFVLRDD